MDEEDILFETKEYLHQEKLQKNIIKLLPILGVISLLIIFFAIIYFWRQNTSIAEQHKSSEIYYKANEIAKLGKIDSALESYNYLIDNHQNGYSSLASLKKANIMIERKEYNLAFETYENFVKNSNNDILLRYFAQLKIATLLVNEQVNYKRDIESLLDYLQNSDNPWRGAALELKLIWLLNSHKEKASLNLIEIIEKDQNLSEFYKQRIEAIKSVKFRG